MSTDTGSMQIELFRLFQNLGGVVLPDQNSNSYSIQGWLTRINSLLEDDVNSQSVTYSIVSYSDNYYRLPTYARTLDLTLTDASLKGFAEGFTDGRYGYFVPYNNGAPFGKVARVDLF